MVDSAASDASTKRKQSVPNSSTNLLDLNDDCLYEIFQLKRVAVADLSSLAQTCTKLKKIGTEIFERSHKIFDLVHLEHLLNDSVMVNHVLSTFGPSISELRICGFSYSLGDVADSIIKNCSSLKSLTIKSFDIPDCQSEISKMALLFEKLEILRMEDVYIEGYEHWRYNGAGVLITPEGNLLNCFSNCSSSIDFKVNYCSNLERSIFESYFPKLQNFEYDYCENCMICSIDGFIFRHKNLKSFSLNARNEDVPDTLKVIATNCKQLEKLCIGTIENPQDFGTSLRYLEKLEHLTELKILWFNQDMVRPINEMKFKPLQVLDLQYIQGRPELIQAIARIKTLRVLKLSETDIRGLILFYIQEFKKSDFEQTINSIQPGFKLFDI